MMTKKRPLWASLPGATDSQRPGNLLRFFAGDFLGNGERN